MNLSSQWSSIFIFFLIGASPAFCQKNNSKPQIVGQTPSPLTTPEGIPISIQLTNLIVNDPDNTYPNGFALKLFPGKDYTLSGNTVTPSGNFSGKLKVPVTVNDGQNESNRFELKIDVIKAANAAPRITGQSPLSVNQGGNLTVELSHLQVTDPDNNYPNGFTLNLFAGKDYTLNGNTVTPSANFSGNLKVPVTVNDGQHESNRFELKIAVIKAQNTAPKITGQSPLSVNQGASLTVVLSHLQVTDPDNSYPTGFTIRVFGGNNYTFNGTTITPSKNFVGQLTVSVTVNDGKEESNRFELKIDVIKMQNVAPQITGQQPLAVNQNEGVTLAFSHLTVVDPDNEYPTGFTLKVFPGNNYTVTGNTIVPATDFVGTLTVAVTVNDGQHESNVFELKIKVEKTQNIAPQITGQEDIKINEDEAITLHLGLLRVIDPDNVYPKDFSLKIKDGPNYQKSGSTITPVRNFSGELTVSVIVNDGQNDSAPFNINVNVSPVNDAPVINGQIPLSTNKNTLIALALSNLKVTDSDNKY